MGLKTLENGGCCLGLGDLLHVAASLPSCCRHPAGDLKAEHRCLGPLPVAGQLPFVLHCGVASGRSALLQQQHPWQREEPDGTP